MLTCFSRITEDIPAQQQDEEHLTVRRTESVEKVKERTCTETSQKNAASPTQQTANVPSSLPAEMLSSSTERNLNVRAGPGR